MFSLSLDTLNYSATCLLACVLKQVHRCHFGMQISNLVSAFVTQDDDFNLFKLCILIGAPIQTFTLKTVLESRFRKGRIQSA